MLVYWKQGLLIYFHLLFFTEERRDEETISIGKGERTSDGAFQIPSKPIDVPCSTRQRSRPPPQRSDSDTSSTHMEVDECVESIDKIGGGNTDIDSGFENMEASFIFLKFDFQHF